jgi:4-hydroxythreonine-4-phosphate dehydrogenase
MDIEPQILIISTGEPAGIGPEVSLLAIKDLLKNAINAPCSFILPILVGDIHLLSMRAQQLGLGVCLEKVDLLNHQEILEVYLNIEKDTLGTKLLVHHIPLQAPVSEGKLDLKNAVYVHQVLETSLNATLVNIRKRALVTAPINKFVLRTLDSNFSGHTEFFADRTKTAKVVMMLVCEQMKVALATTHLPLNQVSMEIHRMGSNGLLEIMRILHTDLQTFFAVNNPKILVTGLNPHAGEAGTLGQEEKLIIEPAILEAQTEGINVTGPFPADTLFQPKYLENSDAVLSMFHDQGLPVLKYASFGQGVNVTLGLPFIRTSVDHGTALDIAGTGKANPGSMKAAIALAQRLLNPCYGVLGNRF